MGDGGRDDLSHEQISDISPGQSGDQLPRDVSQTEPHLLQEILLTADGLSVPGAHLEKLGHNFRQEIRKYLIFVKFENSSINLQSFFSIHRALIVNRATFS